MKLNINQKSPQVKQNLQQISYQSRGITVVLNEGLTKKQRECFFILRDMVGHSYAKQLSLSAIAQQSHCSIYTVRRMIHKARDLGLLIFDELKGARHNFVIPMELKHGEYAREIFNYRTSAKLFIPALKISISKAAATKGVQKIARGLNIKGKAYALLISNKTNFFVTTKKITPKRDEVLPPEKEKLLKMAIPILGLTPEGIAKLCVYSYAALTWALNRAQWAVNRDLKDPVGYIASLALRYDRANKRKPVFSRYHYLCTIDNIDKQGVFSLSGLRRITPKAVALSQPKSFVSAHPRHDSVSRVTPQVAPIPPAAQQPPKPAGFQAMGGILGNLMAKLGSQ